MRPLSTAVIAGALQHRNIGNWRMTPHKLYRQRPDATPRSSASSSPPSPSSPSSFRRASPAPHSDSELSQDLESTSGLEASSTPDAREGVRVPVLLEVYNSDAMLEADAPCSRGAS